MFLLLASFFAGVLTSLAPCVLPLLPVIVGSSVVKEKNKKLDKKKPYIIAASLGVSVILFTILLKASTVLIGVDPRVWLYISGVIVILLGVSLLFPKVWTETMVKVGLEQSSNTLLARAGKHRGIGGQILTGAALGPVFSSCSPVYALVLATVLPVNIGLGLTYIVAYALGLSAALLVISLAGRKLTGRLGWTANPNGTFRRVLAIILILVGLGVIGGYDKQFQAWALANLPFTTTGIEEKLLPKAQQATSGSPSKTTNSSASVLNVDKPYAAPELRGLKGWINSNPQTLAGLKGKVVLIDFWTYSCINCIRTQPYLKKWYSTYQKDGFVILGIHAPEFAFEKVPSNVKRAVKSAGLTYPIGLDNDFATWKAYNNQYWPAEYLIDKNGKIRYTDFGEGNYDKTETAIQTLLKETGAKVDQATTKLNQGQAVRQGQTPETYFGYQRGERFAGANQFKPDQTVSYIPSETIPSDNWSLGGKWKIEASQAISQQDDAALSLKFSAKEVYLVMSSKNSKPAHVTLNGKKVTATTQGGSDVSANGDVHVSDARLYRLIRGKDFTKDSVITLTVPKGTTINAFTFGG